MSQANNGFTPEALRLIGAALALRQVEGIAASITPLPGTGRFITIGTPAEVVRLLEIAPAAPTDWTECRRIAELPSVHEALQGFSEDATGDSGTCVVRAVLEALRQTKGGAA